MTPSQLLSLANEARADDAKATKGPWVREACISDPEMSGSASLFTPTVDGRCIHIGDFWADAEENNEANMALIANARTREPVLAEAVIAYAAFAEAIEADMADDADVYSDRHDALNRLSAALAALEKP